MYRSLRHLIRWGVFSILASGIASLNAEPPGLLEGHLKILSLKGVELAEPSPSEAKAENYAEYPLIVFSADGKKEIARVTADENGKYRLALPPGDYILDVQGRQPKGHVRAKPQRFTVISDQVARVDMNIDTGIR